MRFYIYELIDPRDGAVFYVGKGQRSRVGAHENQARRGVYSRKCSRIREIWAAGYEIARRRIFESDDENEAFAREIARIEELGLSNLTNVLPGGQGTSWYVPPEPFVWTAATATRQANRFWRLACTLSDGKRIVMFGYDVTNACRQLLGKMARDVGIEKAREILAKGAKA